MVEGEAMNKTPRKSSGVKTSSRRVSDQNVRRKKAIVIAALPRRKRAEDLQARAAGFQRTAGARSEQD
jgi:hypothetical protein